MERNYRSELSVRFASAIESLLTHLYSALLDEWQTHELTVLQARIMETLLQAGRPLRMTELAARMEHNLSSAGSLVDRLVEKGMVQRTNDPADRRAVVCHLTETGQTIVKQISQRTKDTLAEIAQQADTAEMQAMVDGLEELLRQMRRGK